MRLGVFFQQCLCVVLFVTVDVESLFRWDGDECVAIRTHIASGDIGNDDDGANCLSGCITPDAQYVSQQCFTDADCHPWCTVTRRTHCCPVNKVCVKSNTVLGDHVKVAGCDPPCKSDTKDFNKCTCAHADFPNNWVKCTGTQEYETCDSSSVDTEGIYERTERGENGGLDKRDEFALWASCFHNKFREQANMAALKWSEALADSASEWARDLIANNQNDDPVHSTPAQRNGTELAPIGENLAQFSEEESDFSKEHIPSFAKTAVEGWYSGIQNYQWGGAKRAWNNCSADISSYEQFTQLLWRDTKEFGCDYQFVEAQKDHPFCPVRKVAYWKLVVVCQYSPGGNQPEEAAFFKRHFCAVNNNPLSVNIGHCKPNPVDCSGF